MIEALELRKNYGPVEAVKGVSFTVPDCCVVGLLGPNGAGKTTTMRMLTTFLSPSGGTARVADCDIRQQPELVRKQIGYLPETPPLYFELTVEEYLRFVAGIKGLKSKDIGVAVDRVLERCSLSHMRRRLCGQLSKGYRQRVGIAQAIIHNPKVIILDEPTSGLDPSQILEARELISSLGEDHTVILSSHIIPEIISTCKQIIIIAQGQVVVDGPLEELVAEQSLESRFLEAVSGGEEA